MEKWHPLERNDWHGYPEICNYAAVEAAATYQWSNGPVEGHVNRLKTIKCQMYGRAGFELLRKRVLFYPDTG